MELMLLSARGHDTFITFFTFRYDGPNLGIYSLQNFKKQFLF